MFANFFSKYYKKKRLSAKLDLLKGKKEQLLLQLGQSRKGNQSNARRSDRKFKENSGKALTARAKRANKSALLDIDRQIKFTQSQLDKLIDKK